MHCNLHADYNWKIGVYRSPVGYQHPWLAVGPSGTRGAWTRREARELLRNLRE